MSPTHESLHTNAHVDRDGVECVPLLENTHHAFMFARSAPQWIMLEIAASAA